MAEIEIVGLDRLLNRYVNAKSKLSQTIAESINTSHQKIMEVAKERTPVDTGALQESGIVRPPEITSDMITSIGAFGGEDIDYALTVHEDLNVHHNTGQAKYYESATEELKEEAVQQLNNDVFNMVKAG
jgi:hypothetical protein